MHSIQYPDIQIFNKKFPSKMTQVHMNELGTLGLFKQEYDDSTCNYSYSELNAIRTIIVLILVFGIIYLLYKKDNIDNGKLKIDYNNLQDTNDKTKLPHKNKTSLKSSEKKQVTTP